MEDEPFLDQAEVAKLHDAQEVEVRELTDLLRQQVDDWKERDFALVTEAFGRVCAELVVTDQLQKAADQGLTFQAGKWFLAQRIGLLGRYVGKLWDRTAADMVESGQTQEPGEKETPPNVH